MLKVDGVQYDTYAQAAKAQGLLADECEAQICMKEAISDLCIPYQLRALLTTFIGDGAPARILYEEHLEFLVKNYNLNQGLSIAAAVNRLLLEIQSSLQSMGKTLEGVGLPLPVFVETEIARQQALFDQQIASSCMTTVYKSSTLNN